MILFKKLRWQNFLSYGNYTTEVDFTASHTTLIIGTNGAGKSTCIDALTYVLYNKAFRSINLPQLVNSITNKGMVVELEFSVGSNEYTIRRGQKPALFEMYINGELFKSTKKTTEDQKYLEDTILKMNFKSFSQIVVLGSTNYIPFMNLAAADRRKVVENIMDLEVFSVMNSLLKSKISENDQEIDAVEREIEIINSKIEIEQKYLDSFNTDIEETITSSKNKIDDLVNDNSELNANIERLSDNIASIQSSVSDRTVFESKRNELLKLESALEEKSRILKKEISFFSSNDSCPTCKQDIDSGFKSESIETRSSKLSEISSGITKIEGQISKTQEALKDIEDKLETISKLNQQIKDLSQKMGFNNQMISELKATISSSNDKRHSKNKDENQILVLTKDRDSITIEHEKLLKEKAVFSAASKLLKDTGIKARIIEKYIPIMNQLITSYLNKMDLFVDFQLDENFNEVIKSRYRDEFSFSSFSEGEKARLNLALLFTWRDIARRRNSASTNLLILDEILDGSSDQQGIDSFVECLSQMQDMNIFVISHSEKMNDKFDDVLRFEKKNNFSNLVMKE